MAAFQANILPVGVFYEGFNQYAVQAMLQVGVFQQGSNPYGDWRYLALRVRDVLITYFHLAAKGSAMESHRRGTMLGYIRMMPTS